MLRHLSLRYKIPLRAIAVVLITASLLTAAHVVREREELQRDLAENATLLGLILVENLMAPLIQDDVWRAFELVRAPLRQPSLRAAERLPVAIVLFDRERTVMASSNPSLYPLQARPETLPLLRDIASWLHTHPQKNHSAPVGEEKAHLAKILPIITDEVTLGHLVLLYSSQGMDERMHRLMTRSVLYTLLLLCFILPVTWYWGQRMARPLITLAHRMKTLGAGLTQGEASALDETRDEVGQVASAFRTMSEALLEREAMQRQMRLNERLAAVGRLAAGVAHEINNPLGGMLNALDTHKRHGGDERKLQKTLSLIERGLLQIRDTVSALLVEARPSGTPLSAQDIEDVHTLISGDVRDHGVFLEWDIQLPPTPLPLPATLVRQVLLNLLLNALQSTPEGGRTSVWVQARADALLIDITNEGPPIPPERIARLFEPFVSDKSRGHGLGLWVCYQIIQQLKGDIRVLSDRHGTRFSVCFPLPPSTNRTPPP